MKQFEMSFKSVGQGVITTALFCYMGVDYTYKAYCNRDFYLLPTATFCFFIAGVAGYSTITTELPESSSISGDSYNHHDL